MEGALIDRAYLDGSLKLEKDGLRDEDLTSLGAKVTNLGLEELDLLTRPAATNLEQSVDHVVEVDLMLVRHLQSSPARARPQIPRELCVRACRVGANSGSVCEVRTTGAATQLVGYTCQTV